MVSIHSLPVTVLQHIGLFAPFSALSLFDGLYVRDDIFCRYLHDVDEKTPPALIWERLMSFGGHSDALILELAKSLGLRPAINTALIWRLTITPRCNSERYVSIMCRYYGFDAIDATHMAHESSYFDVAGHKAFCVAYCAQDISLLKCVMNIWPRTKVQAYLDHCAPLYALTSASFLMHLHAMHLSDTLTLCPILCGSKSVLRYAQLHGLTIIERQNQSLKTGMKVMKGELALSNAYLMNAAVTTSIIEGRAGSDVSKYSHFWLLAKKIVTTKVQSNASMSASAAKLMASDDWKYYSFQ